MRRHTTALATAMLLLGLTGPGALASTAAPVSDNPRLVLGAATDPAHDVRITREPGATPRERRSIDVRRLVVTDRGPVTRFRLEVQRVRRSDQFAQLYLVDLHAPGYQFTQIAVGSPSDSSPPDPHGLRHSIWTVARDRDVLCDHLQVSFRDGASSWWVDVPRRCLPRTNARVSVYAQTHGLWRDDVVDAGRQFSWDRLRAGRINVRGTIPPDPA